MKRVLAIAAMTLAGSLPALSQSLDDLNIQIHGYATQGFLYSSHNNFLTTTSSDGSPAWNEDVINLGAVPTDKLHIGIQARYFLLGNYGNTITLDWAQADYKVNDRFGVRVGKIKTPSGLFNETQDIDPSYMFALLPQGPYSIAARNSTLSVYGGQAYGVLDVHQFGKLEYRGFSGVRSITKDDGNFLAQREAGTTLPNGLSGTSLGAAIRWRTPLQGLLLGASDNHSAKKSAPVVNTPTTGASQTTTNGTETITAFSQPMLFGKYERGRVMFAAEAYRSSAHQIVALTGKPATTNMNDNQSWYGMATFKITNSLTAGTYYMQDFNVAVALGPKRFTKDWTISSRYDFNQFLYAKVEEHFVNGELVGYDTTLNSDGLKPTSKLTILKMGVSF